ncbi:hypothetical protein MYU51_007567 [Penicillium brevicompactum]|uniref:uncharacterized protein n=1 Tax=Penicillium brevicompactum TaxID=5074 RepID=UPI002541992C|nr:uncharacterized protein N7506_005947 [Penicillium brevicompactum]KAJ5332164.1 hypothetical protein N7506_005947 [Penicillium brevicompactum]
MRISSLVLFGLASVAVADLNSWNDVVGDVPQCIKTCLNDYYNTVGLKSKCGSPDSASMDCLCGVKDTYENIQDDASDLSDCITNGCDSSELSDASSKLEGFTTRFTELYKQCSKKSAASSSLPGYNAMLASGALLLAGAAL